MNNNYIILLLLLLSSTQTFEASGSIRPLLPTFPVYDENYQDTMLGDSDIATTIRESIESDPRLTSISSRIAIKVQNGKVTLSGEVNTAFQKTLIESRASGLNGVKEVTNNITVIK